jgi:hypothetical protein
MYFTNCLFSRVAIWFSDQSANSSFTFQNCTFKEGILTYSRGYWVTASTNTVWRINNCAFDGTCFNWYDSLNGNTNCTFFNYNSYNLANTNWQTYPFSWPPIYGTNATVGPNDLFVTNGYNWQSSWLGDFYLPDDSLLIDKGSTTADQLGLYHFTTQTNQAVEGDSIVDIGYHYVATDANHLPVDTNTNGIPDYIEDANGNGLVDGGESPWNTFGNQEFKVFIIRPRNGSQLP